MLKVIAIGILVLFLFALAIIAIAAIDAIYQVMLLVYLFLYCIFGGKDDKVRRL